MAPTDSRRAVAIVTGGSSQTGGDVARGLASPAWAIVVVYLEHQSRAEATVARIIAAEGTTVAVRADLADDLDVKRLFTESIAAFGGVDVVVHTAVRGTAVVNQQAARRLRPGSAIVNVSSSEVIAPAIARELEARDITVNGLAPGLEPPGADHDAADLVALLDRWRGSMDA